MRIQNILARALLAAVLSLLVLPPSPASASKYERSLENVTIPDVVLVNQDGEKVRLKSFLQTDKPVVVDFIFGTCTTICPILSAGFANLQRRLGPDTEKVRLVSISIDPEHDTPTAMAEYLNRYQAKPGWDFLTGTRIDINNVMKAFNAYFPDKMSHLPLNFIRKPGQDNWLRLFGLLRTKDFLKECQEAGIQ